METLIGEWSLGLELRGVPVTPEGEDARSVMETRRNDADRRIRAFVKTIFQGAQVVRGGGQSVDGNDLTEKLQAAGAASMVRLYGDFDTADQASWDKVIERAHKGETQLLDELERCSLSEWGDRTQALKGRFEHARMEAAKLLQPEVTWVDLPKRMLNDEADLADWLEESEQRIRDKLQEGPVMI